MRLMQGFAIDPKINTARARDCIDFTSFSGIPMIMNHNEELLEQVALLTEQVAYLTNKLYGKSFEKKDINLDQLSLFEGDNATQDDENLPSHYRNYYLYAIH